MASTLKTSSVNKFKVGDYVFPYDYVVSFRIKHWKKAVTKEVFYWLDDMEAYVRETNLRIDKERTLLEKLLE